MKSIILTSQDDAHWTYLLEIATEDERSRLKLFPIDRLGIDSFLEFDPVNHKAKFVFPDKTVLTESDILSIWYRRFPIIGSNLAEDPEIAEWSKEEYVQLFENLEYALPDIKWVSKPSAIKKARHKAYQLSMAKQIGFDIPETVFTNNPDKLEELFKRNEIIYKAVNNPNIKQKSDFLTIWTAKLKKTDIKNKDGLKLCPGIIQEFVTKKSDIRVSVFGNKIFAVEIKSQEMDISEVDFRLGGMDVPHIVHNLADNISYKCLRLVSDLGLLFGAIDLALMDDNSYRFFEINANGQWGWLEKHTELPLRRAMLDLLLN